MARDTQSSNQLRPFPPSTHHTKPLDFGSEGCTASLALNGRYLTTQVPHSQHGQVLAAAWPQFPADKAYDQPYVRQYRKLPVVACDDESAGYGMSITSSSTASASRWTFLDGTWPRSLRTYPTHTVDTLYMATSSGTYSIANITNTFNAAINLTARLDFPISIHRAAYTQLTPKGDCSIPTCENDATVDAGNLTIVNRHLPCTFIMSLSINGEHVVLPPFSERSPLPIQWSHTEPLQVNPGSRVSIVLRCLLGESVDKLVTNVKPRQPILSLVNQQRFTNLFDDLGHSSDIAYILLRNIDYILGCCLVPLGERGICVITDHQCLPLGWNRDNYWQMKMLYSLYRLVDRVHGQDTVHVHAYLENILRQHMVWVYQTARRPSGHWARCYYTNGTPKDDIFQLDQQCYPLLELADYASLLTTGPSPDLSLIRRLAGHVDTVLENLQKHRSADAWLFRTDETPGDDEVVFPYHFSSHVLLWHTLRRLSELQLVVGDVIQTPVAEWAARVHEATMTHFVASPEGGPEMFAYLSSTTGSYQFYHDANDLPTVLAPRWGFCSQSDPVWQNTIKFAFSTKNTDGYFPGGRFGGLGSVHTPDPWTLGTGQALVLALDQVDGFNVQETLDNLLGVVQWDGMFSEAIDRESGAVTSKHWFSWPGSLFGHVLMDWA